MQRQCQPHNPVKLLVFLEQSRVWVLQKSTMNSGHRVARRNASFESACCGTGCINVLSLSTIGIFWSINESARREPRCWRRLGALCCQVIDDPTPVSRTSFNEPHSMNRKSRSRLQALTAYATGPDSDAIGSAVPDGAQQCCCVMQQMGGENALIFCALCHRIDR